MNRSRRRALVLAVAMGSTAALARWVQPSGEWQGDLDGFSLDAIFPQVFGPWKVDEVSRDFVRPADQDGKLYGVYDRLLERTYIDEQGYRIMLSVAFGAEQSASMQLHRPEVCYRYGGYNVGVPEHIQIELAGRAIPAARLQTELPGRPEPVTYWTVLGGLAARDLSQIRRRRLELALQRKRLDGMLVRISSVDPDPRRAYARQASFADALVRAIAPAERSKVIGAPTQG
mgnify:CR=1 FL=1